MKKIIVLSLVALLCGCADKTASYTDLPSELKDCKIYKIYSGYFNGPLIVVRCPLSQTSATSGGKHRRTAVTVDL